MHYSFYSYLFFSQLSVCVVYILPQNNVYIEKNKKSRLFFHFVTLFVLLHIYSCLVYKIKTFTWVSLENLVIYKEFLCRQVNLKFLKKKTRSKHKS